MDTGDIGQPGLLLGGQLGFDFGGDGLGHFSLQRQDIFEIPLVTLGPKVSIVGSVDESGIDAHPVCC